MKPNVVRVPSTRDGELQDVLFHAPPAAEGAASRRPLPLLVMLHTWSYSYEQGADAIAMVRDFGWVLAAPDYRGPNDRPEACASELAVQDVLDAVGYAKKNARVDAERIYLLGASGGGHMALMMAARAPQLWAGVSAWVPISDLAAWHAQCRQAKRRYADMLERCCGGPPGPQTDLQYRSRSPLFHLAGARGVTIDLNTGIHDGHTGSVPVSHSLRAFNALAEANGNGASAIADADIEFMCASEQIPPSLEKERVTDPERSRKVLWRRVAGPVRVTVFDGGHEQEMPAALAWLSRQRRGAAADFSVPLSAVRDAASAATIAGQ